MAWTTEPRSASSSPPGAPRSPRSRPGCSQAAGAAACPGCGAKRPRCRRATDWYARLEKGHISGVSDEVLGAVAGALQLDQAERLHLFDLARAAKPSRPSRRRAGRPSGPACCASWSRWRARPRLSATAGSTSSRSTPSAGPCTRPSSTTPHRSRAAAAASRLHQPLQHPAPAQPGPKAVPGDRAPGTHHRVRTGTVDANGTVTLCYGGKLYHLGTGRAHARTRVLLLIQDLHVRIINAATGELLRELILDPERSYQPTGRPPGPHARRPDTRAPERGFAVIPMSSDTCARQDSNRDPLLRRHDFCNWYR